MSQLDVIAELRAHRPVAPSELRERVRDLAANAPAPRRRFTWRRALVVAIAVGSLAAVAGVVGTRDGGRKTSVEVGEAQRAIPPVVHAVPNPSSSAADTSAAGSAFALG